MTIACTCRDAEGAPPAARLALAYLRLEHQPRTWTVGTVERAVRLPRRGASLAVAALVAEGLARAAPEAGPHQYTLTAAGRGTR